MILNQDSPEFYPSQFEQNQDNMDINGQDEDLEGFAENGPIFDLENADTPAVLEAALKEAEAEASERVRQRIKKDRQKKWKQQQKKAQVSQQPESKRIINEVKKVEEVQDEIESDDSVHKPVQKEQGKEVAAMPDFWSIAYTDKDPTYNLNAKSQSKRQDVTSKRMDSPKKTEKTSAKAKQTDKVAEESKFEKVFEDIKETKKEKIQEKKPTKFEGAKEVDIAAQLQRQLGKTKKMHEMNDEEIAKVFEESEEYRAWRALPKSERGRLTRKQLFRQFKETSLAESIKVEMGQSKKSKLKKAFVNEKDFDNSSNDEGGDPIERELAAAKKKREMTKSKLHTNPANNPVIHKPMPPPEPNNQIDTQKKGKSRHIIVVHRDPETGELVHTYVEKKHRKKVTNLKKAIIQKRQFVKEVLK